MTEFKPSKAFEHLVAQDIPLSGIHLIEASAGTGKTYNITRIYLRLLLEKQLTVQQILVMTFTKDATEELRGRIDSFIRLALSQWHELIETDDYFKAISKKVEPQQAKLILSQALLYLDEAAIYTIHGFCKRVLTQYAFESGIAFNSQMEGEQQTLVLQAVQDWYRQLASDAMAFKQVVQFWPVPEKLISDFAKALNQDSQLQLDDSTEIIRHFTTLAMQAFDSLTNNKSFLFAELVEGKPAKEQEKREVEYQQLIDWLQAVADDHQQAANPMPDSFIDGRRFSRSKAKEQLVEVFSAANQVKSLAKTLLTDIAKREALAIVKQGIEHIRAQVLKLKQQANILTFDDLVERLAYKLADQTDTRLADSLFQQYPYALIDEFQDTDSSQLAIAKAMYFNREIGALFMIGDPKQAIYGFRGGDIFAYLSARNACDQQWLMDTNWRSTVPMINGYNRLFYGNALTDKPADVFRFSIPYHPVKASPVAVERAKEQVAASPALHFIHFSPQEVKKHVPQSFRSQMATWCVNEIVSLLSADKPQVAAKDIALLVRDGTEAAEIKQALFQAGLASVYLSDRANLLHSEQTQQLIQLLNGILYLENERLFCASLASPLLPYHAQALYQLQQDDLAWQEMKVVYAELRRQWFDKGFIAMALTLLHQHLVITGEGCERTLTNLLHLFEVLQTASQRHRQPQELLHWFDQQRQAEHPDIESELRLESEADLIKIVTQHGSKGLEYPVVFVPFASRHKDPLKFGQRNVSLIEYHDEQGVQTVSLTGSASAKQRMSEEAYAETVRLLYVAVTRAEQRCYVLTTAFEKYHLSPIGLTCQWQQDSDIIQHFTEMAAQQPDDIALTVIDSDVQAEQIGSDQQIEFELHAAQFSGQIERDWWLSSFTALSRNIRDNGVSAPDRDNLAIEQEGIVPARVLATSSQLRFVLTKGANTGNFLHYIFEHINFTQPEFEQVLQWATIKYGELPTGYSQSDLIHWLEQVLITPLKVKDEQFCLADLSASKVLKEAEFYFPMKNANVEQLSRLLIAHRDNAEGGSVSKRLHISYHRQLKGMMHGFIDLIFEHQGKFYLADYKSNHLGEQLQDYSPQRLQSNVIEHHYDLQYLIYSLALHRYLTQTLDNYQPEQHFGGVLYLYLRGMNPEQEIEQTGVYYREITVDELMQLDGIFADSQANNLKNNDISEAEL
ncbi:exodeoxyribonuclease V subunit beta [Thalassotalea sp. G2M2-11]|uniref:exodeoxyribonuclease V subunit beta n=1 Tax=Thalassotalea sp. G2M2-11 TaxID=2787627 RepID=UPI0019D15BA3|nr:exodeoxyribonuclease V subunit beta [Thalassotalea sp. G2M2-11]